MKYTPIEAILPAVGRRSGNFTQKAVAGNHSYGRNEFIRDNGG
jgi:hypothetical protein